MIGVGVMQVVDTLNAGGAERVAVNIANSLPRDGYRAHLCTTRAEGALVPQVAPDVGRLRLGRTHRFSLRALGQLAAYNRAYGIRILHAHSSSLFLASLASLLPPYPAVVWHDHYGRHGVADRPVWLYWLAIRPARGVIAVSQPLAEWARGRLRVPAGRVWYIPNFVVPEATPGGPVALPGRAGHRVVCVANFRRQKDHLTLLRAVALARLQVPDIHLLLVGAAVDADYAQEIRQAIAAQGLAAQVSILGPRPDVAAILQAVDVGVLSSASEGLPLALIEYGMAGLPVIATAVGQCPEVLDQGRAGRLVPPATPDALAAALISLLQSPAQRRALGEHLRQRVHACYSPAASIGRICEVYGVVVGPGAGVG